MPGDDLDQDTPLSPELEGLAADFVVDDGESVVVFGSDFGPTDRIWEVARETGRWKGAFLETTFPDELADLAALTGHLTPQLLRQEMAKFPPEISVIAVHLNPRQRARIDGELGALGDSRVAVGVGRREYVF